MVDFVCISCWKVQRLVKQVSKFSAFNCRNFDSFVLQDLYVGGSWTGELFGHGGTGLND